MDVISELVGVPVADRAELRRLADLRAAPRATACSTSRPRAWRPHCRSSSTTRPWWTSAACTAGTTSPRPCSTPRSTATASTDEEIVAFLFLMVVAGNETTTKLLANAWYWGWRNPDERAKPFADPARVGDWAEETLRFDTSSQMLLRVTRRPVELHGTTVAEGERVLLLAGSANRDGSVFPDPDRYDLDRDTSQAGELRQRAPLLHGGAAGPARGPDRPGRAGRPGGRLRRRPRRASRGSTRSTSGASPRSRPRWCVR